MTKDKREVIALRYADLLSEACTSVVNATAFDMSDRIKEMEEARKAYNKFISDWIDEMEHEEG